MAHGSSQVDLSYYIDLALAHGSSQIDPSYYTDLAMAMAPPKLDHTTIPRTAQQTHSIYI